MNRICIASSGLGHVVRGIEAWADDLSQALLARGENVLVCKGAGTTTGDHERVVPCWTRESAKTRTLLRLLPRRIGWRFGLSSGYSVEQTTFAQQLIKLLRDEPIDVLHVQDPLVALRTQQAYQRGQIATRTILAHGTEESLEFQARISYLQHLAPWHLEDSRRQGVYQPTWTAIPNFIDTDRFCPGPSDCLRRELSLPPDALVILAAAAIKRHHKRIDYLIAEFGKLREAAPDLPVWLVVAGGWEAETDQLIEAAERQLGDRVRFLVRFPRRQMAELYRAADLFTLTSLKEMMPIALLEATASGLPCVVHAHPVMQWMVGPGGQTADLSRPGRWAETVLPLLRHRQLLRDLGQLARSHCLQQFSRQAVVDQILEYYRFVLSDDTANPGLRSGLAA